MTVAASAAFEIGVSEKRWNCSPQTRTALTGCASRDGSQKRGHVS